METQQVVAKLFEFLLGHDPLDLGASCHFLQSSGFAFCSPLDFCRCCAVVVDDDELNNLMPILSHEATGADCIGCIVVRVEGKNAELRCK
jgi:hypothetical protein